MIALVTVGLAYFISKHTCSILKILFFTLVFFIVIHWLLR
ncbi:conserved hypothetical protein [Xenorhabdus bovienii str. feltiae Florida]|uniref:Uncharacterized protein n=1 Tax=Xenorhabdus bovienii str. feltiae Moldova TaxID=1398200 RepID=A0A077P033_XENBV|nr:conserved hypothetical protein [Xenorhabdus bovienii str. feltiae France]CDG93270.1 conserved hypothetical protein [Xenorhabdus bovienii str. feltiae Florida]CDH04044.1 conserved hypothetical protein [Xenorhabdus bovienii str. feltiae Moldova]